jgi:O-antigen/teichoic acid export membrane protein
MVWQAVAYLLGVATAVAAVASLVGPLGIVGVGYGVLASRVVVAVATWVFARRLYPIRLRVSVPIMTIAIAFAAALAASAIGGDSWLRHLVAGSVAVAAFTAFAATVVVGRADRAAVTRRLRSWADARRDR